MSKLFILNGPDKDLSFDLKAGVMIVGRGAETDIQIKDKHVSRRHLRITGEASSYFIEDLRSTNGTFLDGKSIEPGKSVELESGTPVRVGDTYFSLGRKNTDVILSTEFELPVQGPDDTLVMDRRMSRLKNLELIYRVSSVFMHSLNLRQTLEQILTYICDLLKRIDLAAIILVDPETEEILEVISRSITKSEQSKDSYSKTIVKRVIREKNALMLSEMGDGSEKIHSESMKLKKIKSVMCVPLLSRSKIQGVIYVDSLSRLYGFRKEDLSLIAALSSPAAMAIENALLYSNLEKNVEARTKDLFETKESLRASESRFRAIFENMTSGVGVYEAVNGGEDFVILDINQAYRRIEGIPDNKQILRKNLLVVFPSYKGTDIIKVLRKVWETGIPEKSSLVFSEGEEIKGWREYYVYRLSTNEIVAIFDDMTEKKKAEREQKILQEQLFLSQKMESIGALAGGIAHNFRNILQAISGNTEYLEMISNGKEEIKEITGNIFDSVEKGVDLINNILQFSRKDKEYKIVEIDLADIIKRTYGIISRVFNKNIDIQINFEKNLFTKGNPSLLSQVFMNLFNNASDAMPEGGTLTIGAKRRGGQVIASVSDTGIGMSEETLGKIFDPFFTLKEVGKGTGLGLSTVHGIVKQHNGTIQVSSKLGKGTTFKIHFPYVHPQQIPLPAVSKEVKRGKGQKVLIVDDERANLEALSAITRGLGYDPIPVEKPSDAIDTYSKLTPAAVLMDRVMPKMDGIACARKIIAKDPKAKIIIISGYEDSGPRGIDEEARNWIAGYLVKPCNVDELGHMISRALEKR